MRTKARTSDSAAALEWGWEGRWRRVEYSSSFLASFFQKKYFCWNGRYTEEERGVCSIHWETFVEKNKHASAWEYFWRQLDSSSDEDNRTWEHWPPLFGSRSLNHGINGFILITHLVLIFIAFIDTYMHQVAKGQCPHGFIFLSSLLSALFVQK